MKTRWLLSLTIAALASLNACQKDIEDPNEQIKKEIAAINASIENELFWDTGYASSGIAVGLIQSGSGAPPHAGQSVEVSFIARSLNDIGSSLYEGEINDVIGNVTPVGLQTGLGYLPEGSKARIYIPSQYAYGSEGNGTVPPNTTLAYDVELKKVTKTNAELSQFIADTTRISNYLDSAGISAVKHPSGIWYRHTTAGTGDNPKLFQNISIHYNGITLSNNSSFEKGDLSDTNAFGLIDGLKIGLPLMAEGGSTTFYIPSGLAYGTASINRIANAILIFEIRLIHVD